MTEMYKGLRLDPDSDGGRLFADYVDRIIFEIADSGKTAHAIHALAREQGCTT
jgi:hypothetical protein